MIERLLNIAYIIYEQGYSAYEWFIGRQQLNPQKELDTLLQKHEISLSDDLALEGRVIALDSSKELQKVSDKNKVIILMRESNPFSVSKKMTMGPSKVFPKPLDVKEKTLSILDLKIKPSLSRENLGYVACFDPYEGFDGLSDLLNSIYNNIPVEITDDVDETIQRLEEFKKKEPHKSEDVTEIISCLKRIDSREEEFKNRFKKKSS